jgi:hypothetical protein
MPNSLFTLRTGVTGERERERETETERERKNVKHEWRIKSFPINVTESVTVLIR